MIYELQQKQTKEFIQRPEVKQKKLRRNCGNCGDSQHMTAECPQKHEGPKCFACNNFGHRSFDAECPKKDGKDRLPRMLAIRLLYNNTSNKIDIEINGTKFSAVIKNGSDTGINIGNEGRTIGRIHIFILIDGFSFSEKYLVPKPKKYAAR